MANYTAIWRSNYFKVKNPEKFKQQMEKIDAIRVDDGPNGTVGIFPTEMSEDGIPNLRTDPDTGESDEVDFGAILASHLKTGEVAILMEVGSEKLRYLVGQATAINSRGQTKSVDLAQIYDLAKKLASPNHPISRAEY